MAVQRTGQVLPNYSTLDFIIRSFLLLLLLSQQVLLWWEDIKQMDFVTDRMKFSLLVK